MNLDLTGTVCSEAAIVFAAEEVVRFRGVQREVGGQRGSLVKKLDPVNRLKTYRFACSRSLKI